MAGLFKRRGLWGLRSFRVWFAQEMRFGWSYRRGRTGRWVRFEVDPMVGYRVSRGFYKLGSPWVSVHSQS